MNLSNLAAIITIVIVAIDQLTKILILKVVATPIAILPFFNLVLVWNKGISFGIFAGSLNAYTPYILIAVSTLIVGFLVFWLRKIDYPPMIVAVSAVIGGALGNIIDRMLYGAVVDFLDFHAYGWHYPAFNIADCSIVLGIAYILFDSIFLEPKRDENHETA